MYIYNSNNNNNNIVHASRMLQSLIYIKGLLGSTKSLKVLLFLILQFIKLLIRWITIYFYYILRSILSYFPIPLRHKFLASAESTGIFISLNLCCATIMSNLSTQKNFEKNGINMCNNWLLNYSIISMNMANNNLKIPIFRKRYLYWFHFPNNHIKYIIELYILRMYNHQYI